MLRSRLLLLLLLSAAPLAAQSAQGLWQMETSGTTSSLRGIHNAGGGVAWASGTDGTVLRTEDSGYMWQSCAMPPGAEKLDFRAVWAWDANTAIVMSSGPGDKSRLYKTTDGCSHWTLLSTNRDKNGFWDAVVFRDSKNGYLLGDPVEGRFVFLTTTDGGTNWKRSGSPELAAGSNVKGAFAASNTSLLAGAREPVIFGTGGAFIYAQSSSGTANLAMNGPRKSIPFTERWEKTAVPLAGSGDSAGIFSLGYHAKDDSGYGYTILAVGGDYTKPNESTGVAAWSHDARQWSAAETPPGGYRSAIAWDEDHQIWITVGPNGSDLSRDDGKTWQPIEHAPADIGKGGEWNALSLPWVVGPNGRIAKLNAEALPKAPPRRP